MKGGRHLFTCPACGKCFFYWVPEALSQPKVKCYFCNTETFPNGEPPAAPAPVPPAPVPATANPVAAPPAGGTPTPAV
jgi:hypothetical protein